MPIATVLALFAATQLLLSGVECIKLHRRGSPLRPGSLEHFIASPPEAFSGSPRIHDSDPHARISSPTDVHWAQQFTTSSPNGHSDHTSPSGEWDGQLPDELLSYWLDSPTPTARHPQTPATPHIDEDEFVHSLLRDPQTPHAFEPYADPFDHHELHTSAPPSPASSSHTSSTEPPAAGATPPADASQVSRCTRASKAFVYSSHDSQLFPCLLSSRRHPLRSPTRIWCTIEHCSEAKDFELSYATGVPKLERSIPSSWNKPSRIGPSEMDYQKCRNTKVTY